MQVERFGKFVLMAAFAVAAGCSGGDTSGPPVAEQETFTVDVSNVFAQETGGSASLSSAALTGASSLMAGSRTSQVEIRRIRLTVYEVPGNAVLFQKVYDVDPTKTSWRLEFDAPVGATVRLVSELMSVTGSPPVEKVEFSGQAGPVTLTDCGNACTPIPVKSYPGPLPNLEATSVVVTPAGDTIAIDGTTQLAATVLPSGPAYQPVWTSLDSTVARVSASGLVTGRTNGFARIVVAVGQRRDTALITVGQATCGVQPLSIGGSVSGQWDGTDCIFEDDFTDRYSFTLNAETMLTTVTTSATAPKKTGIYTPSGGEILNFVRSTAGDLRINYYLAPGSYELRAGASQSAAGGTYTVATSVGSGDIACATNATSGNLSFLNQTLGGTDCVFDARFEDRLFLYADAGRQITISMTSAFAGAVVIRDPAMTPGTYFIRGEAPVTGGGATATWRAATSGYYQVIFSTRNANATGTYSGSVTLN